MRKILFTFSLLLLYFAPQSAEASHAMGVDITYECISNCTIRVYFRAYRDCASSISTISPSASNPNITGGPGCVTPLALGTGWTNISNNEVTPVCPGTPTRCTQAGAALNGVMEHYWTRDFDFCAANCSSYTVAWSLCCRNNAITTVTNPGSQSLYVGTTTINPLIQPCNSSPQFNNPPVPYICAGQAYTFNQGATDPDGDSVRYYLGPCFSNSASNLPYGTGVSPTQPLGSGWIVNMDSLTGDISIVPDPNVGNPGPPVVGVLCVYVEEYRNDTLIGTIVRDMQITAIPCPANTLPTSTGMQNVSGGSQGTGNVAATCVGSQLCFLIPVEDPDAGQSLTVFWNQNIPGATFTQLGTTNQDSFITTSPDTVQFCWTPTSTGLFSFLMTVRDDACPILGTNQYTFQIIVSSMGIQAVDSSYGCGPADLCATPTQGISPYTFLWTGPGGLTANPNATDSCLTHVYPGPGDWPYSVTVTDSLGCVQTITDTVDIPNTVTADAGLDISICSGFTGNIGSAATTDEVYNWVPATGLSNPNIPNPTVTLTNPGTTPLVQQYIIFAQDTVSGCTDEDTVLVTVNPIPESTFTLPTQTCVGDPVQITYTGFNSNTATYNWDFGSAGTATGQGPHNISWAGAGMQQITLTVIDLGCTSAVSIDSIMVHPYPVPVIDQPTDQCYNGHTYNFTHSGSTYGTSATFDWQFWPIGTPSSSTDENPINVTFQLAGQHFASLQITENGCVSIVDTVNFTLFEDPVALWTYQGGPQCFSNGGNNYSFSAIGNNGPGATYSWTFQDGNPANSTLQNPAVGFTSPGLKTVTLTVTENGCVSTYTDIVEVYPDPVVDAGLDAEFCEGEGGALLTGFASGGTPVYYWNWWCDSTNTFCGIDSVNDNDPLVNPTVSTWYYVQITDLNGCMSGIDSVFVTVHSKPQVNAGPDIQICESAPCQILNPTITGGTNPVSYQWSPAAGLSNPNIANPCARPDTTTIYTLVVTDLVTGCTSDNNTIDTNATITVVVPPVPVADAGPDRDICFGESIMLQGFGHAAGPGYNYQWSPSSSLSDSSIANPIATPNLTTEYILTVWSNGCPSYGDTVRVTVHTNPTVDAGPDFDICWGESITLDGRAWGDPTATGYTYAWTPTDGVIGSNQVEDLTVQPDTATTYYLTATSNWGCDSPIDSATIFLKSTPIAEAGDGRTICVGDSAQLFGGYTFGTTPSAPANQIYYTWSPGATLSNTTIADPWASPVASTWYYLNVSHNTCNTQDSVLVTVIPSPKIDLAADSSIICSGDSIQLTAGGGIGNPSYTWIPSTGLSDPTVANPMAAPSETTTYTLVLAEGGCTDTAGITIDVIPTPVVDYVSSLTEGCEDFTVSFLQTASDGVFYTWDFGDGSDVSNDPNPTHTYTEPGEYMVSLTAVNTGGCTDSKSDLMVRVSAQPEAGFSSNPEFPVVMTLPNTEITFLDESLNSIKWNWDFGDGTASSEQNPTHVYTSEGQYMVTLMVTNEHGCVTEIVQGPYLVLAPDLSIPNVFTPNGDDINDRFLVNYTGSQPFQLEVFDRWGVKMYSGKDKYEGWTGMTTDGGAAPEGIYYYTVQVGDREFTGSLTLAR